MVLRGEITTEKLTNLYDTINRLVQNKNCFYEAEEIKKIKKDEKNIFLKNN